MKKISLAILILVSQIAAAQGWYYASGAAAAEPTTVRDTIDANDRDGQSNGAADEELTATPYSTTYLHWGLYDGAERRAGLQFALDIPQGSTVDSFYVIVWVGTQTSDADDSTFIKMGDEDNAAVYNAAHTHSVVAHPAAVVNDTILWLTGTYAEDTFVNTPNLARMLQVVVDRVGWSSGNYVSVIFDYGPAWTADQHMVIGDFNDSGNPTRRARCYAVYH